MYRVMARVTGHATFPTKIKTLMLHTIKKRELKIQGNPANTIIIILAAFHRRKQSYAPPSSQWDIIRQSETVFWPAARRYLSSFFVVSAVIPKKNKRYIVSLQF